MENFSDKVIYVDVDDTLIFWDTPIQPYYRVNTELVKALETVIEDNICSEVIIWSGTGKPWATKINQLLFSKYNLRSLDKHPSHLDVPDNAYAIDDRLQKDRVYLDKFIRVFSPSEFRQGVAF